MSSAPRPQPAGVVATEPVVVDLARIESVLTSLWRHQDVVPGAEQGVLTRACMSNLIVVCRGREQAALVAGEVDAIVSRHPSRVLLLAFDVEDCGSAQALEAAVSAHCHLSGNRRQICSEMVRICAGGDEARKLPSAARSLVIGDLPKSLWWDTPLPPPLGGELYDELSEMADQVVYSSLQWSDAVKGTIVAADWVANLRPGGPVVMDLAWRGLRPWRELISQALATTALPGAIDGLLTVEIEHGPHGLPQAWLLAGWVASALGWSPTERTVVKGHEMSWRFRGGRSEVVLAVRRLEGGEPEVRRVTTSFRIGGRTAALTFAPAGPNHLATTAQGFDAESRILTAPPVNRAVLVATELQQLEPDRVFRDALLVSRKLAESLSLS